MEGDGNGPSSSSQQWSGGESCLWAEPQRAWLLVYPPVPQLLDPGDLLHQQGAVPSPTGSICCETTFIEGRGLERIPTLSDHIDDDEDDDEDYCDDYVQVNVMCIFNLTAPLTTINMWLRCLLVSDWSVCLSHLLRLMTPAAQRAPTTMTSCWRHPETTWASVSSPCSAAFARWASPPFAWQIW